MKDTEKKTPVRTACFPIDMRDATRTTAKSAMNRQGVGVGEDGDPCGTLTTLFTPAVCHCILGLEDCPALVKSVLRAGKN